jgi:hypothetical protein
LEVVGETSKAVIAYTQAHTDVAAESVLAVYEQRE